MKKFKSLVLILAVATSVFVTNTVFAQGETPQEHFKNTITSARNGDVNAQHHLGWLFINGSGVPKNNQQGFYWISKAAKSGNAAAECSLGFCYENGTGTNQDLKLSFYWYQESAVQGYAAAQFDVGTFYEFGKGIIDKDLDKAAYWYKLAANQGNVKAKERLNELSDETDEPAVSDEYQESSSQAEAEVYNEAHNGYTYTISYPHKQKAKKTRKH